MQEPSRKITLVGGEKVYPQKVLDTFHLANMRRQSTLAFICIDPGELQPKVPPSKVSGCTHPGSDPL